jgi:putative ABC transport system permease protein
MIVTGAILVIMFNAEVLSALAASLLGFVPSLRPVLKTAVAYPLSTRFRTGMTMLLFAMITATVVVMAVVINTTQTLTRLDDRQTAGFDIEVAPTLLSFFSPVTDYAAAFAAQTDPDLQDVAAVGLVTENLVDWRLTGDAAKNSAELALASMAGLNDGYLSQAAAVYKLQARAPGYADDAAVWEALRTRSDVVIVKPELLDGTAPPFRGGRRFREDGEDGPPRRRPFARPATPAEPLVSFENGRLPEVFLELTNQPSDGITRTHRVQVIGVLAENTTLAESDIQGNAAALAQLRSEPVTGDSVYLKVAPGADPKAVAAAVERNFVANGFDATVLAERFAQGQRLTAGILQLLQGFMALGLIVGIAALGVVAVRSVVERRQQIGMLRALGFQREMVSWIFVIESSFVSLLGIGLGVCLALIPASQMINDMATDIPGISFQVPWTEIILVSGLAYAMTLLTTWWPARQASQVLPAEALRYE